MHAVLRASLLKLFYFEAQKEHLICIYYYGGNPLITGEGVGADKYENMTVIWAEFQRRKGVMLLSSEGL